MTSVRELMSGSVPVGQIAWLLAACSILTAVFAPRSLRLFRNT